MLYLESVSQVLAKTFRHHHHLLVSSLVPHLRQHITAVSKVTGAHPRLLAVLGVRRDQTTMALVDLDELLEEGLDSLRRRATATLDAADTPGLDRAVLVVHGELAL
jgi:hypothetical protein